MKEKGEMEFLFLKTRSSSAVGQKIKMRYDPASMKIEDMVVSQEIETEKPTSIEELKKSYQQQPVEESSEEPIPQNAADVDMMNDPNPLSKLAGLWARARRLDD